MEKLIEIKNLNFSYKERTILDDISCYFEKNRITVILGGSGCGKSTLLKNILGFLQPDSGTLRYFGKICNPGESDFYKILRRFGIVFQNGGLINSLSVSENVSLPLIMHSRVNSEIREHLVKITLSRVGLLHALNLYPSELSGGMKKRAAIARALILEPEVLFLDEPSAGLDPLTSSSLDELILSLKQSLGTTIVVVTHELESIRKIADRVIMLDKGLVLFEGTLEEAKNSDSPLVRNFFLRKAPDFSAEKTDFLERLLQ